MPRSLRAYDLAVLGAIGGLIGWQASNLTGLSFVPNIYLSDAVVGALVGAWLGLLIGAAEGLISRNPVKAVRAGAFSGMLGLVAGAVGLPLGEWLFGTFGAHALSRSAGWMVLGGLLGLAEGVVGGTQAWKGALGGALGGLAGGGILAALGGLKAGMLVGKAVGMVVMGACLGAFIGLIVVLLSSAWMEVASGKLKGTSFILDKFLKQGGPSAMLGSSSLKSDLVVPDPDVAPQHAMLSGGGTHMILRDLSLSGTFVNGRRIAEVALSDGQEIQVGNTRLIYHARRSA